jgi:hypothetical protein
VALISVVIAPNRVSVIQNAGCLPYYVQWCVAGGPVPVVLAFLLGLTLELRRYVVALTLSPGTALPVRLSKRFWWGGSRVGSISGTADEVCKRTDDSHLSTGRHVYVRVSSRRDTRFWYPNSSPIC